MTDLERASNEGITRGTSPKEALRLCILSARNENIKLFGRAFFAFSKEDEAYLNLGTVHQMQEWSV